MNFTRFCQIVEYLAGARDLNAVDDPPRILTSSYEWVVRCCVWVVALVLIYAFSGQTSKFIYIDF